MSTLKVAFLGDIYGHPGRMVVRQQLPRLREEHAPDLVIANAENARSGLGLTDELYEKIRGYGVDAVTLGDHAYRDQRILPALERADEPVSRPANLSPRSPGKTQLRLPIPGSDRSLYVITLLGRIFVNLPADSPFDTFDQLYERLPERDALVIVEAHMEATSEKAALAHYVDGRAALVVGTHTHVPTADARILPRGTGFITDVGMCGPYHSIIGREVGPILKHMTTALRVQLNVGAGDERMCGVLATIDLDQRRTAKIQRIEYAADREAAPFKS